MNTLQRLSVGIAALALTSLGLGADASSLSHGDKAFLEKAAKSGMEEVAVSQAALPHLVNAQAKEFATTMATDHAAANEELKALAAKKNVTLPIKQPDVKKWAAGKDKDFDEDYIEKMARDHDDVVDLYAKAAKKSDDPDIQAFAAKMLPTLRHHLDQAKMLKKTVK